MARPLRIQFAEAFCHVTCRGNAWQGIFANDMDRTTFLSLLNQSRQICQVETLAYHFEAAIINQG